MEGAGPGATGASNGASGRRRENSLPAIISSSARSSVLPPLIGRVRDWLLSVAPRQRSTTETRKPTSTPAALSICARVTASECGINSAASSLKRSRVGSATPSPKANTSRVPSDGTNPISEPAASDTADDVRAGGHEAVPRIVARGLDARDQAMILRPPRAVFQFAHALVDQADQVLEPIGHRRVDGDAGGFRIVAHQAPRLRAAGRL